jgi:molybdenum cofactor synthesis domain-containing protein
MSGDTPFPAGSGTADVVPTAAMLVIGDEILSGRTKDRNIGFVASYLTQLGIDLKEARVVPDDQAEIVVALNALRARYTYVFTSGGIGPTHDDITADAVAAAFGVTIDHDPRAVDILTRWYAGRTDLNAARLRMARIPAGADLIENRVSGAPGFRIGNVHVMAGVPAVMEAMMDAIAPTLARGAPVQSVSIDSGMGEGRIAGPLAALAKAHPATIIGSYPYFDGGKHATIIVVRSRDADALAAAAAAVRAMIDGLAETDARP